jgi:hypothetical protein
MSLCILTLHTKTLDFPNIAIPPEGIGKLVGVESAFDTIVVPEGYSMLAPIGVTHSTASIKKHFTTFRKQILQAIVTNNSLSK